MYTDKQLDNAGFMFVSCVNSSRNPTNLESCQIKIQHFPTFSQFETASYFEVSSLVHFEAHGRKYGTSHTFKVSQLINYNSVFYNSDHTTLRGSEIYLHSFEKNLSVLKLSENELKLISARLDKYFDFEEGEYLQLLKKKAFLMTLQGKVIEIISLRNEPDSISKSSKSTHWKFLDSNCFDIRGRTLSEGYCDFSNDMLNQFSLDTFIKEMQKQS